MADTASVLHLTSTLSVIYAALLACILPAAAAAGVVTSEVVSIYRRVR